MTTGQDTTLLSARHRPLVAGVLGLTTFIAFESFAVTTALPVVAADLGAQQWYSLAFAATLTTGIVGMTIGGAWADRRGVAAPLAVGGTAFVLGIALCVVAPNMGVFVAGRLLQGIGGGVDSVVVYVVVAGLIPERLRPRMFGLLVGAWLLPAIAGPLLSGVLVDVVGWRVVFALVLVGSAGSLVVLLMVVTHAAPGVRGTSPVFGRRAGWAVAAALAVLGLHLAGQQPMPALLGWTALGVGVVALTATRLLPGGTFRARAGVPRLVALRGLLGAAVAATDIYLPLYLQYERGYTPTLSGLVVAIGAIGWMVGAWAQGRIRDPAGDPAVLHRAVLLVLCGPAGALALVGLGVPVAVTVVACIVMGVGMGTGYPQITAAVLQASAPTEQGTHSSSLQMADSLGASALLAITAAVLTALAGSGFVAIYGVVLGVAAVAVVMTGTVRRHPVRAPEAPPRPRRYGPAIAPRPPS